MLITAKGQMVRTRISEIRAVGGNTMGVKLMDRRGAEKLQTIAPVVSQAIEEEAEPRPKADGAKENSTRSARKTRLLSRSYFDSQASSRPCFGASR